MQLFYRLFLYNTLMDIQRKVDNCDMESEKLHNVVFVLGAPDTNKGTQCGRISKVDF